MLKHIAKDLGLTKDLVLPLLIGVPAIWLFLALAITAVTA